MGVQSVAVLRRREYKVLRCSDDGCTKCCDVQLSVYELYRCSPDYVQNVVILHIGVDTVHDRICWCFGKALCVWTKD